jgi:hypothetical protein
MIRSYNNLIWKLRYFARHFDKKKIYLEPSRNYFRFKTMTLLVHQP